MEKLARSQQLRAVTDPQILVLFEDWLDELEAEVISFVRRTGSIEHYEIARGLGLSRSGAKFLLAKLEREGKI